MAAPLPNLRRPWEGLVSYRARGGKGPFPAMSFLAEVRSRLPASRRYLGLSLLLPLGLATLVLAFLFTSFDIDFGGAWETMKASDPLLFALAFVVHYASFVFRSARWRLLLQNVQTEGAKAPGLLHCLRLVLTAWALNSVTWFRMGDAYRAYAYSGDTGESFSRTAGTVLSERVLDVAAIFVLVVAGSLMLIIGGASTSWLFVAAAAFLAGAALGLLALMVFFRGRLAHRLPDRLQGIYQRFHHGVLGSLRRLPLLATFSLLTWLAEAGRLYLVCEAVGVDIGPGLVIFVGVANALLTLIPLTPGGLGITETGMAGLLMASLTEAAALSVTLLDRFISFFSILIVGGAVALTYETIRRLRPAAPSQGASPGVGHSLHR